MYFIRFSVTVYVLLKAHANDYFICIRYNTPLTGNSSHLVSDAVSGEDERCRLDLVLAPTNLDDFQVGIVLEFTNTTLEFMSNLLESTSNR